MKIIISTFIILLISLKTQAADLGHCALDEMVIFSCSLGKRSVSVCASKDAGKDRGYVQYRFGQPGKLELVYPEHKEPANKFFSFRNAIVAGGYSNSVTFSKGSFNYTVTSLFSGGESGFVEVSKSGKAIATLSCKSAPISVDAEDLASLGMLESKD